MTECIDVDTYNIIMAENFLFREEFYDEVFSEMHKCHKKWLSDFLDFTYGKITPKEFEKRNKENKPDIVIGLLQR